MSFTNQVNLDVMLAGSAKPSLRYVDRSSTAAVDVSKLDVCFGGFTPMALSDGTATHEQVEQAEARMKARREAIRRAEELERARMSEPHTFDDGAGTVWTYVLLDETEVRITRCETTAVSLAIPEKIEGFPVVSIGADACSSLPTVEEIRCPETLVSIGYSAFRRCPRLERIAFPEALATFNPDWLRSCNALCDLKLPGGVDKITPRMIDYPSLSVLRVGANTSEVEPGAFQGSKLTFIEVSPENEVLSSDGQALYGLDEEVLVALAVPCERYTVLPSCRAVAKKAFSNFACLKQVDLPDGVEAIGSFAFAKTSISEFVAPTALRLIGEKAFFECRALKRVELGECVTEIGSHAFSGTSIAELRLPKSIDRIGNPLAAKTGLSYSGPAATFSIAKDAEHLLLDEAGCLYRKTGEGLVAELMLNPVIERYAVAPGTVAIADEAFSGHAALCEIDLPEGLAAIGRRAFKGCRSLTGVRVPATVREIGDEAFLDTALAWVELPANLDRLGGNALVTYGAHHGEDPSLREVILAGDAASDADAATVLSFSGGLLVERKRDGAARLLLGVAGTEVVNIPSEVDEVAPYALNGLKGVCELHLSDRISHVGMRGLAVDGMVELVHVDLLEPVGGHASFDLRFPHTDRGEQQLMLALSVPDHVDMGVLFEHYDASIINAASFDVKRSKRLSLYDQAMRIVARLSDPVYLTQVNRSMGATVLKSSLGDICVEAAKHDDRALIDSLLDLGFIADDNINDVIDRVGAVLDASITGYLLEAKRTRFGLAALDFDL